MKRFYCTICKRIKRVRRLPATMDTPNADKVADRQGVCYLHNGSTSNVRSTSNRKVAK